MAIERPSVAESCGLQCHACTKQSKHKSRAQLFIQAAEDMSWTGRYGHEMVTVRNEMELSDL